MTALAPTLQPFFTDRLTRQRNASPHTIAGYRDTWRMLLTFAAARTMTAPSSMSSNRIRIPGATLDLDTLAQAGPMTRSKAARKAIRTAPRPALLTGSRYLSAAGAGPGDHIAEEREGDLSRHGPRVVVHSHVGPPADGDAG